MSGKPSIYITLNIRWNYGYSDGVGLHQGLLMINRRLCNKLVAASLFIEMVLLHFSASLGWTLMMVVVHALATQILQLALPPLLYFTSTLQKKLQLEGGCTAVPAAFNHT